jgi:metal-responsive CopG/Arc/MetJ family transcriptional regulator
MVTLAGPVLPVILQCVKTAISLPDDLFQALEARARALRLSRSGLIARAAREFLEKPTSTKDATEEWNRAIAAAGQPGDDPAAAAFRKRSKAIVRRSARSND